MATATGKYSRKQTGLTRGQLHKAQHVTKRKTKRFTDNANPYTDHK